jgi:transglutaminase-like putative cysteine protease
MKRFKTISFLIGYCLLFIAYFFIPLTQISASGEFQADYNVQYDVSPTGITIVTQNISLTNKITNLYPQKYSILIDSENIRNVIAYDDGGMINAQISQLDNKTQITLPFNQKVIGIGKQLKFSLRYEDIDIAHKNGSIWEINIPGVANDADLALYSVSLRVPPTFGPNAYTSPLPANGAYWTKDQMVQGGISAAYGSKQAFSLDLSYYLENVNVVPVTSEIALPPETAYQHVIIQSLLPKPTTIVRDADGNWLAQYTLLPTQRLDIKATVTVLLQLTPLTGATEPLNDTTTNIASTKYWPIHDPQIQQLAKEYNTPRAIYRYVVNTLSYDYNRVNQSPIRKGAIGALSSPKNSICMEFTDLFIAIARAAGIPAREVVGYAYTTNARLRPLSLVTDVLHSWPEYYDDLRKMWTPIDPTWANTTGGVNYFDKLDFNHIVFAIHGKSDDYPNPAGFYKQNGKTTKDVNVKFADLPTNSAEAKITTSFDFPQTLTSGFPGRGNIILTNESNIEARSVNLSITSAPFDVAESQMFDNILPYAKIAIPVTIQLPGYFLNSSGYLRATVNGETKQFDFTIRSFVNTLIVPSVITFVSFILLIMFVLKSKNIWKHR